MPNTTMETLRIAVRRLEQVNHTLVGRADSRELRCELDMITTAIKEYVYDHGA